MGIPTRKARLEHAAKHCELWDSGKRDEFVASQRTIAKRALYMYDPVGTELISGPGEAEYMGHTFNLFQAHHKMKN